MTDRNTSGTDQRNCRLFGPAGIFDYTSANRFVFCLSAAIVLLVNARGQCPAGTAFTQQVSTIYDSGKKLPAKLSMLLALQQKMRQCQLVQDSAYMFLLQKMGVLYSRQEDYARAISFTDQSILAARACMAKRACNAGTLAENYYNLYYYYGVTGNFEKKYASIDSMILYALNSENRQPEMLVSPLNDKSAYHFNKGDYTLCSKDAKLGAELVQNYYHENDSIKYVAIFATRQANALYFSGSTQLAESLLNTKIQEFEHSGKRNEAGPMYTMLGLIQRDKHNYESAFACFQNGYVTDSLAGFTRGCAVNLGYLGMYFANRLGNYTAGLAYCARALRYAEDAADSLLLLQETGSIHALAGNFEKAQSYFQQAFNTIRQGLNESSVLQRTFHFPGFNLLQSLSDLTTEKGDAFVKQYRYTGNKAYLATALAIYKRGDLFLAKVKAEQQLQISSTLVWRKTARNLYEHAIEACYANNNIEDALYFFEKSRAVLLNDQINEQKWMANADIARQAKIKQEIIHLETELEQTIPGSASRLAVQDKIYKNTSELESLATAIKSKNPLFFQDYMDTVFMSLSQLRSNILTNDKMLLEIFAGDSAVYVLAIATSKASLTAIKKQGYDSLVKNFNNLITDPEKLNKNFRSFLRSAHGLQQLLFGSQLPVEQRIIVSPDGVNFPLEALTASDRAEKPEYLLERYAISYTYSVKYLTNQFTAPASSAGRVLGIAPVRYDSYTHLQELSGSDESLKTIEKYYGRLTSYVYSKATKKNFLQNFPQYDIIQLYTHAADSSNNSDPVIYFSDAKMYLSELLPEQKPVTQLVVLSACETANGKLYEGEGIFSFNRGFAALGVPAAVSTLWSVDNIATYRITELFYKYLAAGLPTDIALQQAKLQFINSSNSGESKLPYFWAAPVLTGKVATIKSTGGMHRGLLIAGGILLTATIFFGAKYLMSKLKQRAV